MADLAETAAAMVAGGKGILAADESISTMSARLEKAGAAATESNRRDYRELLVTTPKLADGISGVILCDETFNQQLADGEPFPAAVTGNGLLPGIKVDTGAKPLAAAPGETITEGLDGLRERLTRYAEQGARFAKWRAVINIGDQLPTSRAVLANAHALARYAALCQEAGIVPIVEPEVLMDGAHTLERCAEVTSDVLGEVFRELVDSRVDLAGIVLKPNMVLPGTDCPEQVSDEQAAAATVRTLRTVVPDGVAGIAFLSGGQGTVQATRRLAAMHGLDAPWPLTFSFGRALVDQALAAWHGDLALVADGQRALAQRVACNAAAVRGTYTAELERESVSA